MNKINQLTTLGKHQCVQKTLLLSRKMKKINRIMHRIKYFRLFNIHILLKYFYLLVYLICWKNIFIVHIKYKHNKEKVYDKAEVYSKTNFIKNLH